MNVKKEILEAHRILETIRDKVISNVDERFSATFKIKNLPNHDGFDVDANTHKDSRYIFTQLDKIECDCLYWFSLETKEQAKELNSLLNKYRKKNKKGSKGFRCVPATSKNEDSEVLYVGIRRGGITIKSRLTNITGRVNQHLGYYHKGSTQGLQLIHFAKECDFDITINVVKIESSCSMYLNIIEKLVAKKLKPLCGRH
ncbi:hypothetical protein [uncultured Maribacter sp.]|uniref:hypothetical protein n=1 Tax=uncultured Maribacter sp. TaxID=431308 RepID=UPI00263112EF|nr:hypothetical protein [uncultured Maribacter sp.]